MKNRKERMNQRQDLPGRHEMHRSRLMAIEVVPFADAPVGYLCFSSEMMGIVNTGGNSRNKSVKPRSENVSICSVQYASTIHETNLEAMMTGHQCWQSILECLALPI